jgi:hypothetical protein
MFVLGVAILSLMPTSGLAQTSCPGLVEQAITALGDNCSALDRNTACYGYDHVEATFSEEVTADFFTRPADRTILTALDTLRTAPLNVALEEWGIAVLNVQANVPNTVPGQAVTVLLMGDVAVENRVAADSDQLVLPSEPITIITQTTTDMLSEPNMAGDVLASLPTGSVIEADAISPDSGWLRAFYQGSPGWISISAVNITDRVTDLPQIGEDSRSPMQAFYFQTGFGTSACNEAPSLMAVQGPDNLTVNLSVNGADIQMGSLVTLQTVSPTTVLIVVHEGHVETADGLILEEGQAVIAELDDEGNIISWGEPRPATPEELHVGDLVQRVLIEIGDESGDEPTDSTNCGPGVVHTVAPGENLFRIAQRYNTSVAAIQQANGLGSASVIFVGQRLAIPCGVDRGIPSAPPQDTSPQTGGVDCSPFRATSPLDGLPYGMTIFYWDPAPGATGYRLNIYNLDGGGNRLAASFETGPAATNLAADITNETVGLGFDFAWEVQALFNGQVACTSTRATIRREIRFEPTDRPSGPAACTPAPPSCNFNYICERCLGESQSFCGPAECPNPP